jgi:hypothetical protein
MPPIWEYAEKQKPPPHIDQNFPPPSEEYSSSHPVAGRQIQRAKLGAVKRAQSALFTGAPKYADNNNWN